MGSPMALWGAVGDLAKLGAGLNYVLCYVPKLALKVAPAARRVMQRLFDASAPTTRPLAEECRCAFLALGRPACGSAQLARVSMDAR